MFYNSWDDDGYVYVSRREREAKRKKKQDFLHGVMSAGWAWMIVFVIAAIYAIYTGNHPVTTLELSIATGMAVILSLLFLNNHRTFPGALGLVVMHAPILVLIAYVISTITG